MLADENRVYYDGIVTILAEVKHDDDGFPREWSVTEMFLDPEYNKTITLRQIRDMFPDAPMIKVIIDEALTGNMFVIGNHRECGWEHYGTTIGYA